MAQIFAPTNTAANTLRYSEYQKHSKSASAALLDKAFLWLQYQAPSTALQFTQATCQQRLTKDGALELPVANQVLTSIFFKYFKC